MDNTSLPCLPLPSRIVAFAQAMADALNPGAACLTAHNVSALYPVFVNNTENENVHHGIIPTVMVSVLSAYLLFGFPGDNT